MYIDYYRCVCKCIDNIFSSINIKINIKQTLEAILDVPTEKCKLQRKNCWCNQKVIGT